MPPSCNIKSVSLLASFVFRFFRGAAEHHSQSNMDEEYLRLAVHSSLTKALQTGRDNGNGPCQCGLIRRRRSLSLDMVKPIYDKRRDRCGLDPTWEEDMVYRQNSSFQLSHVCRGAQKLTKMIESSSNVLDGSLVNFPEDLLRGALDLQESLVMLSRLQDASKEISQRKRKQELDSRKKREEQEPRLSMNVSSRNCSEELKSLIRDSFRRQNHLSVSSDVEKASSSTSSNSAVSRVVGAQSHEKERLSETKSSNLIAKLMGLKDASSPIVQPIKNGDKKSKTTLARPNFDTVMPKSVKLPLAEQKKDRRQKPQQEITGTQQFERLHISDAPVEEALHFSRLRKFEINAQKDDVFPPIPLLKPQHYLCCERGAGRSDLILGNTSMQGKFHSVNLVQENKLFDTKLMPTALLEIKEVNIAESVKKKSNYIEEFNKRQKKDGVVRYKKANVAQNPPLNGKKQAEKTERNDFRARIPPATSTTTRKAKTDKRPSAKTGDVHNRKCLGGPVSPKSIGSTREKKASALKSVPKVTPAKNKTKKFEDGTVRDPLGAMHSVPSSNLPDDDLRKLAGHGEFPCNKDNEIIYERVSCEVTPMTNAHEMLDPDSIPTVDKVVDKIIKISGSEKYESAEEYDQLLHKKINIRNSDGNVDVKQLLLRSQSFLNLAQGLFDLDVHQPIYYRRNDLEEIGSGNKLLLDCGKELLTHKSHHQEVLKHPLTIKGKVLGQSFRNTLDQLVEETSNGIESLISSYAVSYDATPEDSLYITLERELMCKEMSLDVVWDIGWRNPICVEESDRVVGGVEEHILSFLVEEIVSHLLC